ncbi:MAG: oxidoreductase [Sphingomonas bacterium]|nr:oxidoreductase [Sphingomonas bacterium]
MQILRGRRALVTGAAKGIGAAIARALGEAGAAVAVNYASDRAGAEREVAEIVAAGGSAIAVQGDVASAADVARMVDAAVTAFGGLDILVNNAALYEMQAIEAIGEAEFHRYFGVNLLGPILLTQAALPHFGAGACILNISSTITAGPVAQTALYSSSKAALNMLGEVLAIELGSRGIRVNTLSPGITHTDGHPVGDWDAGIVDPITARTPLGRLGTPAEIAASAVFLVSEAAGWVTGVNLPVSGGFR